MESDIAALERRALGSMVGWCNDEQEYLLYYRGSRRSCNRPQIAGIVLEKGDAAVYFSANFARREHRRTAAGDS